MTLVAADLGSLGSLAIALGFLTPEGDPEPNWLSDPASHLRNVVADGDQREALLSFVDEALGGGTRTVDDRGVVRLPVLEFDDPDLRIEVTVDASDDPDDREVILGVAVRLATTDPIPAEIAVSVPLFRTPAGPNPANALVLGTDEGRLHLTVEVTIDEDGPEPGQAALAGMAAELDLPTSPQGDPAVAGFTLRGLQLPGSTEASDLRLSADPADPIEDQVLGIVLGLIEDQAHSVGGAALEAAAGLLGLAGDAVPPFPIDEVSADGLTAAAIWLASVLTDPTSRSSWSVHLADFLGGSVEHAGDPEAEAVVLDVLGATVTIRVEVTTDPAGHTLVTPIVNVTLGDDATRVEVHVMTCRLDLTAPSATALVGLGAWAASGSAAQPVVPTVTVEGVSVEVERIRLGLELDGLRRPTVVLAADDVTVGATHHPVIDLTSVDAVMEAAGDAVDVVLDALLSGLGDALTIARLLLGLDPPPGHPTVPVVAPAHLLADPVAAILGHYRTLLTTEAAAVPALLAELRNVVADRAVTAVAVIGSGTVDDPWRLPLVSGAITEPASGIGTVALTAWLGEGLGRGGGGDEILSIAVEVPARVDHLGERCTVLETTLLLGAAEIDLAARSVVLVPAATLTMTGRERGADPATIRVPIGDEAELVAAHLGACVAWRADTGLTVAADTPDLTWVVGGDEIPIALPTISADGGLDLDSAGWALLQDLVGSLEVPGLVGHVLHLLGWSAGADGPVLDLADLVADPGTAIAAWLPGLLVSEVGPDLAPLVAELLATAGPASAIVAGTGHPDDPYRIPQVHPLPQPALWFHPNGPGPLVTTVGRAARDWRPGDPAIDPAVLAELLAGEATIDADLADLVTGRDPAAGLADLIERWTGGDGRIAPPTPDALATRFPDVTAFVVPEVLGTLLDGVDLDLLVGRTPDTVLYVSMAEGAWSDRSPERRIDLTAPGLTADQFALPTVDPADTGDWFVALGSRSTCRVAQDDPDGTRGQADRLGRVLDALAPLGDDLVVVATEGAGHAARRAAGLAANVSDLVLVATPLGPISLTALSLQPAADGLRLLARLLPSPPRETAGQGDPEDRDLATGRALVDALLPLAELPDPGIDLRPAVDPPTGRDGLTTVAVFGQLDRDRVARAITAVVLAGLAARARDRSLAFELAADSGVTGAGAGLVLPIETSANGSLAVEGDARLQLIGIDADGGVDTAPELRVRLRLFDRQGWLTASANHELRMVSIDTTLDLGAGGTSRSTVVLHDARVDDLVWERLTVDTSVDAGGVPLRPLLPEARQLLDIAVQRLAAETTDHPTNTPAVALAALATELGIIADGGVVNDAVEHLVNQPLDLIRSALAAGSDAADRVADAVDDLLGPVGAGVDLVAGTVRVTVDEPDSGLFGWRADLLATFTPPALVSGQEQAQVPALSIDGFVAVGPSGPGTGPGGGVEVRLDLGADGPTVAASWHRADGGQEAWSLWPTFDRAALTGLVTVVAPGLVAQAALEAIRAADEAVTPLVDAALDAVGLLVDEIDDGTVDRPPGRRVRSLAPILADPGAWLGHPDVLSVSPGRVQGLLDALRPLIGVPGLPGQPYPLAPGITVGVSPSGAGLRVDVAVDTGAFDPPTDPGADPARLVAGFAASIGVDGNGPPQVELGASLGIDRASPGRPALLATLDGTGQATLVLRPSAGADIGLVPFAGFGSVLDAAEAVLPFVLDRLAERPAPVGAAVAELGDALGLRSGVPARFDGQTLIGWATDPADSLVAATQSLLETGLSALAPLLDDLTPPEISIGEDGGVLSVATDSASLAWSPAEHRVEVTGRVTGITGIGGVGLSVIVTNAGLQHLVADVGPGSIEVAGIELRPFAVVCAGLQLPGATGVEVGLGAADGKRFGARWMLDPGAFALVAGDGPLAGLDTETDPIVVASCAVELLIDVAAGLALSTQPVEDLLDRDVFGGSDRTTLRDLLAGIVLDDDPTGLIDDVLDPTTLLERTIELVTRIIGAEPSIAVDGIEVRLLEVDDVLGVQVGLTDRYQLTSGETILWLENDDSWIVDDPDGDGGLFLGLVDANTLDVTPTLRVNGLGLRLGALSGPLVDIGLTLESIAFHTYAAIDAGGLVGGGLQVQFSELAVDAAGASGGNSIAQGILADTGSTPPRPAFSPALAIQSDATATGGGPVVTLRAGDGAGPWWVGIRKGFGPLYIEQIGFGVAPPEGTIDRISLFFDGSVSLFGLSCFVDDLEITYVLTEEGGLFNPASWSIDLAGLAVSADLAGLTVSGGLLKSESEAGIEYLGMLMARFGVYGITIYGGYGEGTVDGQSFVSFFAVGAFVGPIGGPPAFFLTGIGGGFGINRELVIPADLADFGDYPLIKALDTGAQAGNPMEELRALGQHFPMQRDTFWFAAGVSFNSFVIVDGIAVVAVEIGDGLDINLLGQAQLALPRPEVAMVSIELALLARFSSSEGVIWVQGQLTDNSYLLYEDVRLTGGFAFVLWFSGPNRGQFVITIGGYHPDFNRPDYPVVPRIGLEWQVTRDIVIKAGGYFALTSEALMAGGDFEASADFGFAWAEVGFGANGIVYFDPFHYKVDAYARIAAGATVDLWILGEVTLSVSLGASIEVEGPDFHGKASVEVGPVTVTVPFGSSTRHVDPPLDGGAFVAKYLEADGGRATVFAVVTSAGAAPAPTGEPTPDGQPDRPLLTTPEFSLILTSVMPLTTVNIDHGSSTAEAVNVPPSRTLGVAPMGRSGTDPELTVRWKRDGTTRSFPFAVTDRPVGAFPVGIWGPPQDDDNRPLPKGEVIEALNEVTLDAIAVPSGAGPEIPYDQVDIGKRHPLPLSRRPGDNAGIRRAGRRLAGLATQPTTAEEALTAATTILEGTLGPTSLLALAGERQAPPLIGTLGEGLDGFAATVAPAIGQRPPGRRTDHSIHPPQAIALLNATGPAELGDRSRAGTRGRTTVTPARGQRPWRVEPPSLAAIEAERSRSVATGLLVVEPPAAVRKGTVVATADIPPSTPGRGRQATVRSTGSEGRATLEAFTTSLTAGRRARAGREGAVVGPGDTVVLRLPNARRDTVRSRRRPGLGLGSGAPPVRIVALSDGGALLADAVVEAGKPWTLPRGAERLAVVGLGRADGNAPTSAGLSGWHAGSQLPYVGWSTAVGPGCTVTTRGEQIPRHDQRAGAGWVAGSELTAGDTTVVTRFTDRLRTVILVIDDPDAGGDPADRGALERRLLLGLDGATRRRRADGRPTNPVVVSAENRSIIAYPVVAPRPTGGARGRPVPTVDVSAGTGSAWSLVAVLGSADLEAEEAAALITARGLDAALAPLARGRAGRTRLQWIGEEYHDG